MVLRPNSLSFCIHSSNCSPFVQDYCSRSTRACGALVSDCVCAQSMLCRPSCASVWLNLQMHTSLMPSICDAVCSIMQSEWCIMQYVDVYVGLCHKIMNILTYSAPPKIILTVYSDKINKKRGRIRLIDQRNWRLKGVVHLKMYSFKSRSQNQVFHAS